MKRVIIPVMIVSAVTLLMSPMAAIARSPQRESRPQTTPYMLAKKASGGAGQGTGRRSGGCPPLPEELLLTALVPQEEGAVIGRTLSEQPTLWFYVPYTNATKIPARFSLQTSQEQSVHSMLVSLPSTNGIIGVQLPASVKLPMNQPYRWTLQLECTRPAITVWGWVERVPPPAGLNAAASLPTPQRAAALMQNGLWLDALTVLGNARLANPNDSSLNQAWTQLFNQTTFDLNTANQGRLPEIIQQPLVK